MLARRTSRLALACRQSSLRHSAGAAGPESGRVPDWLRAFPIGVFTGGVGSFVGIGGALLMVVANATALVPNVATCVSSAYVFGVAGDVDWTAAALVACSAAATTRVGCRFANRLSEALQKQAFGVAMLGLGPLIAAKPMLQRGREDAPRAAHDEVDRPLRFPPPREAMYLISLGSITGLCSGVMGIGAGAMCTVGLAVGGPAEWSHKVVLGTAFAAQLLPHATGAYTHWQLGNLRTGLVPALVAGAAVGSALASRVAVRVDEERLRALFAAYAVALGAHSLRAGRALRRVAR